MIASCWPPSFSGSRLLGLTTTDHTEALVLGFRPYGSIFLCQLSDIRGTEGLDEG